MQLGWTPRSIAPQCAVPQGMKRSVGQRSPEAPNVVRGASITTSTASGVAWSVPTARVPLAVPSTRPAIVPLRAAAFEAVRDSAAGPVPRAVTRVPVPPRRSEPALDVESGGDKEGAARGGSLPVRRGKAKAWRAGSWGEQLMQPFLPQDESTSTLGELEGAIERVHRKDRRPVQHFDTEIRVGAPRHVHRLAARRASPTPAHLGGAGWRRWSVASV